MTSRLKQPATLRRVFLYTLSALLFAGLGALAYPPLHSLMSAQAALETLEPSPVDTGFAQSMSLHHQQAIGMSQLMLDGRPTRLAPLARSIAYSQLLELGEMRGWLRLWQQPLLPTGRSMTWMLLGKTAPDDQLRQYLLDCERSPTGMAGLATDVDINRLRQLDGRERDRHFLTLMLAHHQGGLPMARFAAREARLRVVKELAGRVVYDQVKEIDRMQRTLLALDAAGNTLDTP